MNLSSYRQILWSSEQRISKYLEDDGRRVVEESVLRGERSVSRGNGTWCTHKDRFEQTTSTSFSHESLRNMHLNSV